MTGRMHSGTTRRLNSTGCYYDGIGCTADAWHGSNIVLPVLDQAWRVAAVLLALIVTSRTADCAASSGVPCVFDGHLKTDKNWYGYLANISVVTTARMTFEFTYPADRCCQNVLFYTEDQTSIISARMNCWQKEYLLRPEDDQILRLTPRFSWSGCHMTHPNGVSSYHCEGGRSFTVESLSGSSGSGGAGSSAVTRSSGWYIAASNCAALNGLDLRYRLVIYGHVGDCPSSDDSLTGGRASDTAGGGGAQSVRSSLLVQHDAVSSLASASTDGSDRASCRVSGLVNRTQSRWHGFIGNMSLARGGGFRFRFRFQPASPASPLSALRVLLYRADEVTKLSAEQTCWQKNGVIRKRYEQDQVIFLSAGMSANGCVSGADEWVSCRGERRYEQPQRLFVAVSDCHSERGLQLDYELDVYGVTNVTELCSSAKPCTAVHRPPYLIAIAAIVLTATAAVGHR